jgi:hypothetical protein
MEQDHNPIGHDGRGTPTRTSMLGAIRLELRGINESQQDSAHKGPVVSMARMI